MARFRLWFGLVVTAISVCSDFQVNFAHAGEMRLVMARRSVVHVHVQRRVGPVVPVGLVLDVVHTQGDWLWVGRGWVQQADVVEVTGAVEHFTAELAAQPSAFAYVSRARAHLQNGDAAAAAADCQAALALDPDYAPAHCQLGRAEHDLRHFNAAHAAFNRAIELEPRSALGYCYRAQTLQASGDATSALADFDRAVELDEKLTPAYFARGTLRSQMGDAGAEADFTAVIELHPGHFPALNNRANLRANQGRYDEAVRDYTAAFRVAPRADVLTNRAHALRQVGRLQEALNDCNEAIRMNPAGEAAYRQRAVLHEELGRPADAAQDHRQADQVAANRRT